jgi:hypothetical protein
VVAETSVGHAGSELLLRQTAVTCYGVTKCYGRNRIVRGHSPRKSSGFGTWRRPRFLQSLPAAELALAVHVCKGSNASCSMEGAEEERPRHSEATARSKGLCTASATYGLELGAFSLPHISGGSAMWIGPRLRVDGQDKSCAYRGELPPLMNKVAKGAANRLRSVGMDAHKEEVEMGVSLSLGMKITFDPHILKMDVQKLD